MPVGAAHQLVATTYPDGTTETATHDAENHRLTSTDAAGHKTSYAYDAAGRMTTTTHPDATTTTSIYDDAGNVIGTTDELGKQTTYGLDADNRRVSTTDPLGHVTQTVYDDAGRAIVTIDGLGHSTIQTYDNAGRVTATTFEGGANTASTYDAAGRQTTKTDELGRVTTYGYDALGRLTSVKDAVNQLTQYAYDERGNRTSQTDANGHVTTFQYDSRGHEIGRALPDGKSEGKGYDSAGRLQSKVDFQGRLITYAYDARNHLISCSYADGTTAGFTYTPDGQRASATDSSGTTAYSYDSRRHVTRIAYPDGRMLDYGYDARGARTSLTARIGSQSYATSMTYDAAGIPDHVTDLLSRVYDADFDADGNRTALSYPNTTTTSYAYDVRNRLTTLTTTQVTSGQSPTTVQSHAYVIDDAGNRTAITEGDGTHRSYGYDGIDRLTSEVVTGANAYTRGFTYDAVGNRLTQTKTGIGTGTTNYAYDARDQLKTEDATTYGYDSNGNVTAKSGDSTYTWDLENRLIRVTKTDGTKVEHVYDVDGNRVQTKVTPAGGPAKTTKYLIDTANGLSHVVADTDGATGALSALYVRMGDELLSVMRPDGHGGYTTRFVHHDGLGSVRALTDESGITTDTKSYEAFGSVVANAGSDPLPYGFAGEPLDTTSGLAYHRARWMDARVGRFLGMDRFGGDHKRPVSLHRYLYANVNPANRTDPTGRSASTLEWGNIVHRRISADFLEKLGECAATNITIATLVSGGGSADRPDLTNGCNGAVYDIKTEREFGVGVQIVADYVETMLEDDSQKREWEWHPGELDDGYEPPLTVGIEAPLVFAVVDPPVDGVITYDVWDLRGPVYALGAAGAVALGVGLIGTSVGFGVGLAF